MGSELSTPTVVVGGATVAAGIVGAALFAKQHPGTPEVASSVLPSTSEKGKGKGKAGAGGGRKRKGGNQLAASTKPTGDARAPVPKDDTPPALAAQAALFDASATDQGQSSAMEDVMASTTSVGSKSSRRKRGKKSKAASPTAEPSSVVQEEVEEEEEEEEEEVTPLPTMTSSSSGVGSSRRGHNKFSTLMAETQYISKPSMDASWLQVDKTRAGSKRRKQQQQKAAAEVSSDAGFTPSATGDDSQSERGQGESNSMQALASKIGHVQPKTQVDDMLPPEPTISRVMRVQSAQDDDHLHSTDADAEEEGWGIVRRRRTPLKADAVETPTAELSDDLTKDQRRREARKDATKVAKADAEAERLKRLAQHKKEQERARMQASTSSQSKKTGRDSKVSGGMRAVVQDGKLVWE